MTAASNSEGRKRHEEAALTLRDIGRANGHGDPVPGMCPECGETATADEVTRQMVAQVAAHQAELQRLTEERDEFKGAAGHAFTFQSERDQSRNAHERTKQSLRRMTVRAEAAEARVAEKAAEIERLLTEPLRSDHPALVAREKAGYERGWDDRGAEARAALAAEKAAHGELRERVRRAAFHPYKGPDDTDTSMLRAAATRLRAGYEPGGSNTKQTVARVLDVVAVLLDTDTTTTKEGDDA